MEILKNWLITRVVSSFKCKPEQGDALAANETSIAAINQFFADEECQRLLVYAAPDLTAVRNYPPRPLRSYHAQLDHTFPNPRASPPRLRYGLSV